VVECGFVGGKYTGNSPYNYVLNSSFKLIDIGGKRSGTRNERKNVNAIANKIQLRIAHNLAILDILQSSRKSYKKIHPFNIDPKKF